MSQLKISEFSRVKFKDFEVLYFSMSATTTQLLSSGEFYKMRSDTRPVKSASATLISIPITRKRQILSCDILVANERLELQLRGSQHNDKSIGKVSSYFR